MVPLHDVVWEPHLSPSQIAIKHQARPRDGWLWPAHSHPFRTGCERRARKVSGGWDGFRCTESIDRIRHRLRLSVQGDQFFRPAWAAARRAPGTRKGEQDT